MSISNHINEEPESEERLKRYPILQTPMGRTAINILKDLISSLPIKHINELPDGTKENLDIPEWLSNPTIINPDYTSHHLISGIVDSLLLDGNAYLFKIKDESGTIRGLYLLDPATIQVSKESILSPLRYQVSSITKIEEFWNEWYDGSSISNKADKILNNFGINVNDLYTSEDIIHIPLYSPSFGPWIGISPFHETAVVDDINSTYNEWRSFFDDYIKAEATYILNSNVASEKRQAKSAADRLTQVANRMNANQSDAKLIPFIHNAIINIVLCSRVPRELLIIAIDGRADYVPRAIRIPTFTASVLTPYTKHIESGLNLLLEDNSKIVLDLSRFILGGDPAKLIKAGQIAAGGPVVTRNEFREMNGLPPIEGGDVLSYISKEDVVIGTSTR